MPDASGTYVDINNLLATLREPTRHEVQVLWGQAQSYVWGWQDHEGGPQDSEVSWCFGLAYAWHAVNFAAGNRSSRQSIREAFRRYRETGRIE